MGRLRQRYFAIFTKISEVGLMRFLSLNLSDSKNNAFKKED